MPENRRNRHEIQTEQHKDQQQCQIENEMILNRQPVVVLKQISRSNIGMTSRKQEETNEDRVDKNGSIPQDANVYLQDQEQEYTNHPEDSAAFAEELGQLDAEENRKLKSKGKHSRTGNIYQEKMHKQCKEVQSKRNKQSRSRKSKKTRKRKMRNYHEQIIVSSSENEHWQPSEEEYVSTDESEYIAKSVRRKKLSSTMKKQTTDNHQKQRCEEEQS